MAEKVFEQFVRELNRVFVNNNGPLEEDARIGIDTLASIIKELDASRCKLEANPRLIPVDVARGTLPEPPSPQSSDVSRLAELARVVCQHGSCFVNSNYIDKLGKDFLQHYGSTTLIGPGAPFEIPASCRQDVRCGLIAMAPHLHYPSHHHPAHELYMIVSGTALWQKGSDTATALAPGSIRYHSSWVPHAMITQDEPLVAAYIWWGDVDVIADLVPCT